MKNYLATLRLYPVTHTDQTFAEWEATFDEAPGDEGKYVKIVSNDVFAGNFKSLAALIAKTKPEKPEGAERWKGFQPNKVWTSRAIKAPVDDVWKIMRDFAGMGGWHERDHQDAHAEAPALRQGVRHPRFLFRRRATSTRSSCTSTT